MDEDPIVDPPDPPTCDGGYVQMAIPKDLSLKNIPDWVQAQAREKINSLQAENAALKARVQELQAENARLVANCALVRDANKSLTESLDKLKKMYTELKTLQKTKLHF